MKFFATLYAVDLNDESYVRMGREDFAAAFDDYIRSFLLDYRFPDIFNDTVELTDSENMARVSDYFSADTKDEFSFRNNIESFPNFWYTREAFEAWDYYMEPQDKKECLGRNSFMSEDDRDNGNFSCAYNAAWYLSQNGWVMDY